MKLSNEAKIGIAVFLAAAVFIVGVMYLRGIDFQKKEYSLTVFYSNVNGLSEGSPITIAGLTIGKVEGMKLAGTSIAVTVSIQNKVHFSEDSKAFIKSTSLMGGKQISISPGISPRTLQDGDSLIGAYEADLTELTSTLAPISSNVLGILERVNSTFDNKTRLAIQNILSDVNKSTQELHRLVVAEGQRLDVAIQNFAEFSANLSHFAVNLDTIAISQRANIDTSMMTIRIVAANLERASNSLKSTSQSLDAVMNKIESGQGTLGKLVHEDKLYNHIDSVAVNLHLLIKDLRENPGRYVKVSVF
jgi:phospholipid/cholesterol/gamma-HCH transport system substrate-binding protein